MKSAIDKLRTLIDKKDPDLDFYRKGKEVIIYLGTYEKARRLCAALNELGDEGYNRR